MVSHISFGWYTDFEKPLLFSGQGLLALFSEGGMVRGRGFVPFITNFPHPNFCWFPALPFYATLGNFSLSLPRPVHFPLHFLPGYRPPSLLLNGHGNRFFFPTNGKHPWIRPCVIERELANKSAKPRSQSSECIFHLIRKNRQVR